MYILTFFFFLANNADSVIPEVEKLYMEGKIVQKLECRPYADNCYMKLKLDSIRKASVPTRQVKQLDRVVQAYKPVSDHKNNVIIIVNLHFINIYLTCFVLFFLD